MLKNYLLVAFRSLRRHKGYSVLNVLGLAVGMACCLFVVLFIHDEWRVDRFHERSARIVRMQTDFVSNGEVDQNTYTQGILAPALEEDLPEVEHAVRLLNGSSVFQVGEARYQEDAIKYADASVFQVFSFPLLTGDPETALAQPNSLVLSQSLARKYFGDADPMGETVLDGERALTVTGVMADVPRQSHLQFEALVSLNTLADPGWFYTNWFSVNFRTYVLLRPGTSLADFAAKLPAFIEARAGDAMREMGEQVVFYAEPLADVYLHSARGPSGERGSASALFMFGAVGLFVLLIACVNFTNLATARSVTRAKEVGVRKTLGAPRGSLAAQFLAEAVLLSTVSLVLALGLVHLILPAFNRFADKAVALTDLGAGLFGLVGFALIVGLFAGAYPAFLLSGFRPAQVLKGRFSHGRQGVVLRQGLVVLQFGISIALIAATGIVFDQLRYMQHRDLGFDLSAPDGQLITLDFGGDGTVQENLAAIKDRFLALPAVTGITSSMTTPAGGHAEAGGVLERPDGALDDFGVEAYLVDSSFVSVYGMEIIAGQSPSDAVVSDSLVAYVLNETAVRKAGYTDPTAILGRKASFWGYDGEVVGVVRDFHTRGLQEAVEPLAIVASPEFQSLFTLRVQTADLPQTLASLEALWAEVAPQRPFTYRFLDEAFNTQYAAEQRFGRLFGVLAGLAVFIACLGLFGLAAFAAAQRTKELGIRKVLGASVPHLIRLLTQDVVRLVGLAFLIAAPLAYVAMDRWLEAFAYRITLGPAVFLLAGMLTLVVAFVTVSTQAYRAAATDPIHALRYE